jgi:germination protein M
MLKKMSIRKIAVASLTLFVLFLLYLMPGEASDNELDIPTDIEYTEGISGVIYLIDSDDYVARTTISTCDCDTVSKANDLIEGLIIDGEKSNIIPNGFRSIIPSGTSVLDLDLKDKVLTINFSKELLEVPDKYSEKMLESIIYTLTSIEGIDKVIIKVEGETLTNIPNTDKNIPTSLDKSYGINKVYELTSTTDIDSYTVYYVNSYNDNYYYVPITKYVNGTSQDDKVKVIIEELANSPVSINDNLVSYLDVSTVLNDYELKDKSIKLNFNDTILSNTGTNKILEEVVYTISLSMEDLYGVEEVSFYVNDEEIQDFKLEDIK